MLREGAVSRAGCGQDAPGFPSGGLGQPQVASSSLSWLQVASGGLRRPQVASSGLSWLQLASGGLRQGAVRPGDRSPRRETGGPGQRRSLVAVAVRASRLRAGNRQRCGTEVSVVGAEAGREEGRLHVAGPRCPEPRPPAPCRQGRGVTSPPHRLLPRLTQGRGWGGKGETQQEPGPGPLTPRLHPAVFHLQSWGAPR